METNDDTFAQYILKTPLKEMAARMQKRPYGFLAAFALPLGAGALLSAATGVSACGFALCLTAATVAIPFVGGTIAVAAIAAAQHRKGDMLRAPLAVARMFAAAAVGAGLAVTSDLRRIAGILTPRRTRAEASSAASPPAPVAAACGAFDRSATGGFSAASSRCRETRPRHAKVIPFPKDRLRIP